jgi:hypothetical protein
MAVAFPADLAVAESAADGRGTPFFGYHYRILTAQGEKLPAGRTSFSSTVTCCGFALVAWPAEYGVTGVNTFIVNQVGQVHEKNPGAQTSELVKARSPGSTPTRVGKRAISDRVVGSSARPNVHVIRVPWPKPGLRTFHRRMLV